MAIETGITTVSKIIPGEEGNYFWDVRFDEADGFIGIDQTDTEARVLLSSNQVDELIKFVESRR